MFIYRNLLEWVLLRNMSVDLNDESKYKYDLLKNVSRLVEPPCPEGKSYLTRGDFRYFHYYCDEVNDAVRQWKLFVSNLFVKMSISISTIQRNFILEIYWFCVLKSVMFHIGMGLRLSYVPVTVFVDHFTTKSISCCTNFAGDSKDFGRHWR